MHLPDDWQAGIDRLMDARRTLVLGATDMGKSSFIRAAMEAAPLPLGLIDLDPGQKMVGAPGTVSLGYGVLLERFIFIGTTSASTLRQIIGAATTLAEDAAERGPFIVNTSGFIRGPGARLQSLTIGALKPDLIVTLEAEGELAPILEAIPDAPVVRLSRPSLARRKPQGERRRIRQAAFAESFECAASIQLDRKTLHFEPAQPQPLIEAAHPVCALADAGGRDTALAILEGITEDTVTIFAAPFPAHALKLGQMWAEPREGGWTLLDRISPSWEGAP